jgi:hypothetical protein
MRQRRRLQRRSLDDLLKLPGVGRRSILPDAYTVANQGNRRVCGDNKVADWNAAQGFCDTNGGGNN